MSKHGDNEIVTRGILRVELRRELQNELQKELGIFRVDFRKEMKQEIHTEIQSELQKFEHRFSEEQGRKMGIMFERTQDLIMQLGETMEMRFERLERTMDVAKEWLSNHEDRITTLETKAA